MVATDADGDSLTYATVDGPSKGAISGTAPNLAYTPSAGFVGSDQFTFMTNDGALDSNLATVSITVLQTGPTITSFTPATARPGTRVTISGTLFTGATSVVFNGVAASFRVTGGGTGIATTVPTGATTGPITVTTSLGTATSSASFVVIPPRPTLTSFSPISGPVGTLVTIQGTGFTSATAVQFRGVPAVFTVVDDNTITATVPPTATTGRIVVVTLGGSVRSLINFTVI